MITFEKQYQEEINYLRPLALRIQLDTLNNDTKDRGAKVNQLTTETQHLLDALFDAGGYAEFLDDERLQALQKDIERYLEKGEDFTDPQLISFTENWLGLFTFQESKAYSNKEVNKTIYVTESKATTAAEHAEATGNPKSGPGTEINIIATVRMRRDEHGRREVISRFEPHFDFSDSHMESLQAAIMVLKDRFTKEEEAIE